MNYPITNSFDVPSYEEMYRKLLEQKSASKELVLPYPIEEVLPLTGVNKAPLSERDRFVKEFYRIMAKATDSEESLAHYLKKTG